MNEHPLARAALERDVVDRQRRLRLRTDRVTGWLIAAGGLGVLAAMLLILGYLLWTVLPLFGGASYAVESLGERPGWAEDSVYLYVDERGDLAFRVAGDGAIEVIRLPGLERVEQLRLPLGDGEQVLQVVRDAESPGLFAAGTSAGTVWLFDVAWERLPGDPGQPRTVVASLDFPHGEVGRFFAPAPIERLAIADTSDRLVIAAVAGDRLVVERADKRTDFLTGEATLEGRPVDRGLPFAVTGLAVDGNLRWVTVADDEGRLHRFDLPGLEAGQVIAIGDAPITALAPLAGGVSLLAGDAAGEIIQLSPVRGDGEGPRLVPIRRFDGLGAPVAQLLPESRRRGFVAVTADGAWGLFHSTAGERLLVGRLPAAGTGALAFPARSDQLVQLGAEGALARVHIDNPHPEANLRTLWRKVWYENYDEPRWLWQSTAANDDFEPKLSLTPLAVGTLKASLFAMAFAVPIALLGATYTAVFMAPALRRKVKPTIELMAAMPTVILGFLAGLWLAPFIEDQLAGVFALVLVVPLGLVAFAWAWTRNPALRRRPALRGWEPVLLIPVIVGLSALALWLAPTLEQWLFGQDLREWLSQEAGISYDQRNALVVGVAMGFSIIPIIFSIAEDALYSVPASLSDGAMALGATRWQTLVGIVLPTASPGIFSGLMIGLGRAVGETMIVLMATGNTPIMGWSAFEGMRTLAANIAIELPESAVAGTHYRVLFLSALVLFLFTFVVNTVAELVRQRLRDRYASL